MLCRCGHSRTKPFCDASQDLGFDACSGPGSDPDRGPSTRAVHAGLPPAKQGEPFLPGPVFAAPFHLAGDADAAPYGYARDGNPTWAAYEAALGELEGGEAVVFASGMAAVAAVLLALVEPGGVLVVPGDGYPGVRRIAQDHMAPRGSRSRVVPSNDEAFRGALARRDAGVGRDAVEPAASRSLDVAAIAEAAHAAGRAAGRRQHARHAARASARWSSAPTSRSPAAPSTSPATATC